MNSNYTVTPSYYNDQETFLEFLGHTSYYLALQNAIDKVIEFANPKEVLEMGIGTGQTTNRMAAKYKGTHFHGIDMRDEMVEEGYKLAKAYGNTNVSFEKSEMIDYVKHLEKLPDFTYCLYSFHHIPDPLSQKIEFLKICKSKMDPGSMLCIGETFLRTVTHSVEAEVSSQLIWMSRALEGYASTFWNALDGISPDRIERSKKIGLASYEYINMIGDLVKHRTNEYMVTVEWINKVAKQVGFEVVLCEPVNDNNDYVVLLKA